MVTEDEKKFAAWWEQHRDKEKRVFRQWLIGLPVGLLFAVPIILNFSAGWYKRATMWARGHTEDNAGTTLIIAGCAIITFIAIFYKRHQWEMYEQQYREILSKMDDDANEHDMDKNNIQ